MKKQSQTPSSQPSLLPRLNFTPYFLYLLLLSRAGGQGMGHGVCSQFITHYLCCSFILTIFPCSSMDFLPRDTVLHKLVPHGSFLRAAVLQKLLQGGVLSTGCSPSGTGWSSVGSSPQGHKSCQQICSSVAFSLHGSTGLARTLLHHVLSRGSQPPLGISTCSGIGSSTGRG